MRMLQQATLAALLLSGCPMAMCRDACALPALDPARIEAIGMQHLRASEYEEAFLSSAETCVTIDGCNYTLEVAEKLDSLGVGVAVEIDRNGHILGVSSLH